MANNSFIKTLDFGFVPVRRTHKEGRLLANIELTDGNAEIRADYKTEQPFAVLFDDDWNEM